MRKSGQILLLGLASSLLIACGNKSSKKDQPPAAPASPTAPAAPGALTFPRTVSLSGLNTLTNQNCTTVSETVSDLTQYCNYLRDESKHNYCAKNERDAEFNRNNCNSQLGITNPNLKENPNQRNRDFVKRPRRTDNQIVDYTCQTWAQQSKVRKSFGGLFNFHYNRVVPSARVISWNGKSNSIKKISTSKQEKDFGKISVEMIPAKGKELEPTARISVVGFDRNKDVSVRGFVDQKIYLEITEDEAEENVQKFLRVECAPSSLTIAKNINMRPVDCIGEVVDTNKSQSDDISQSIDVPSLGNANQLLTNEYEAFQDLILNANTYHQGERGDEMMMARFSTDSGFRGYEFGANLFAPLEIKFENKSQRSPSKLELKCSPRG